MWSSIALYELTINTLLWQVKVYVAEHGDKINYGKTTQIIK